MLDAHARAGASPEELRALDHVMDFNQPEVDCPACGTRFRAELDRCPDCGLRFAREE